MTHKRMRMILNGKSAGNPAVREAVEKIRERGYALEARPTWESGDAARLAVEALEEGLTP